LFLSRETFLPSFAVRAWGTFVIFDLIIYLSVKSVEEKKKKFRKQDAMHDFRHRFFALSVRHHLFRIAWLLKI
jgi:hypothetical protein